MQQTKRRVIIVEDSPTVRYQVKLLLNKIDVEVVEAGGEIGLFNQIEQYGRPADLVIMDLTLKNEHGFDLIKKLKENEAYKDIPILILTEHADKDNVLKAKSLGVQEYVKKPIQNNEFVAKVISLLYKR